MGKNIILTGFMGTGKSSVGTKVAERLNRKFVDMDREIEKLTGMTVSELFRRYGEVRFRSEEKLMAKKIAAQENLVVATGGGIVLDQENIELLKSNGTVVCLEADPQEIFQRVSRKKGTRPLLKKNLTVNDIVAMLEERKPYYQQAEITIQTSGRSIDSVVDDIIKKLSQEPGAL
jgi:shikimate kinase